ncbi:MAG: hypothetical protein AAF420_12125, partial [Pseudomonadota bacterium]
MSDELFATLESLLDSEADHARRRAHIEKQFLQTRAVMILDSSGFTRVSRDCGIVHFLECLAQARQKMVPVLQQHNAASYHFEADNVFA